MAATARSMHVADLYQGQVSYLPSLTFKLCQDEVNGASLVLFSVGCTQSKHLIHHLPNSSILICTIWRYQLLKITHLLFWSGLLCSSRTPEIPQQQGGLKQRSLRVGTTPLLVHTFTSTAAGGGTWQLWAQAEEQQRHCICSLRTRQRIAVWKTNAELPGRAGN